MQPKMTILIAEDDAGHYELVKRNLWRSCVEHDIMYFKDGQDILDFLFHREKWKNFQQQGTYILLLDIRMPKVDGVEVLRQIKADDHLKKIPVIMLTTTDRQSEVNKCYDLGCSFYMPKPPDYLVFMKAVETLGKMLSNPALKVPIIKPN